MELAVGSIVEGKVAKITNYGAFVDFEGGGTGMIHISEVANTYVKDINDHLKVGETVKVKVIGINEQNKVSLSIKATLDKPAPAPRFQGGRQGGRPFTPPRSYGRNSAPASTGDSFEDMMNRFKRTSDDKMSDLRRIDNRRSGNSRRGHSK